MIGIIPECCIVSFPSGAHTTHTCSSSTTTSNRSSPEHRALPPLISATNCDPHFCRASHAHSAGAEDCCSGACG